MEYRFKVYNYNNFLIEKEFQNIRYSIYELISDFQKEILENNNLSSGGFIPIKDEEPVVFNWDIEHKSKYDKLKDRLSLFKSKLKDFESWIREQDADINIEFKGNVIRDLKQFSESFIDEVKSFLSKITDINEIKKYFETLVDDISALPYSAKKFLLIKLTAAFMLFQSVAGLSDLASPEVIVKEPVMSEVKKEIENKSPEQAIKDNYEKKSIGSKFEVAQKGVHKREGEYTEDPDDKGNWTGNEVRSGKLLGTKFGIAAPTLVYYYEKNNLGTPTKEDMMNLTYDKALEIYKKDYWDAQKLYNFKSQSIANILYDGCVNQGTGATLEILTKSLENVGIDSTNVNTWNEFHDELIDDVNELPKRKTKKLFETIWDKRLERYQRGKKKYLRGWKNRLDDITFNDAELEDPTRSEIS